MLAHGAQLPGEVHCGGDVLGLHHQPGGVVELPAHAEQAREVQPRPRLVEEARCQLAVVLREGELAHPPGQVLVCLALHVLAQLGEAALHGQHARHVLLGRARQLVVLHGAADVPHALQVRGVAVVRGALVDAVRGACHRQRARPLPAALQHRVEQVEPPAVLVEPRGVSQQTQLHRHHGNAALRLGLGLGRPQRPHAAHVAHVAEADGCHIEPAALHAHVSHGPPYGEGVHALDGREGGVHAAQGQLEGELEQGGLGVRRGVLQPGKVPERASDNGSAGPGGVGHAPVSGDGGSAGVALRGHEDQVGHPQPQQGVEGGLHGDAVVLEQAALRRHEERLHLGLASAAAAPVCASVPVLAGARRAAAKAGRGRLSQPASGGGGGSSGGAV
mmetsp:Transcript_12553/g.48210  ORF Transcript_12553/g.48210 Transcript_12553/m.48210 type:complete len:389 (+) Transcript_12553:1473-2639(+)